MRVLIQTIYDSFVDEVLWALNKDKSLFKYRHELKQEISYLDMFILRQRLLSVMQQDSYAADGKYEIRSLYFDNARIRL